MLDFGNFHFRISKNNALYMYLYARVTGILNLLVGVIVVKYVNSKYDIIMHIKIIVVSM